MSRAFIETICAINGEYPLLDYHQHRVDATFLQFYKSKALRLQDILLPAPAAKHKARVVYDAHTHGVTLTPYTNRIIEGVQLVHAEPDLDYSFKYRDRTALDELFEKRGKADEVIILQNEQVTDSYYANVAFWDGSFWYTPDSYLLNGVRRQALLAAGKLKARRISAKDLRNFERVSFINGMVDLGEVSTLVRNIAD